MQLLELYLLLSLAQLDLHVPRPIVILQEDVSTMQLSANLQDAQTTNVIQLLTNVKLLFQTVMMVMHVPLMHSTHLLAVLTLQNALLLMHVPLLLAPLEFVTMLQRTVMTATLAPSTLAIFAQEHVSTLQSLALAVLVTSELAILKPLSAKSEKHAPMTVTVLLMEIQLTLLSVTQQLDVTSKLTLNY